MMCEMYKCIVSNVKDKMYGVKRKNYVVQNICIAKVMLQKEYTVGKYGAKWIHDAKCKLQNVWSKKCILRKCMVKKMCGEKNVW